MKSSELAKTAPAEPIPLRAPKLVEGFTSQLCKRLVMSKLSHSLHELLDGNSSFLVRSPDREPVGLRQVQSAPLIVVPNVIRCVPRRIAPGVAQRTTPAESTPLPAPPPPVATPAAVPAGFAKLVIDVPDRGTGYSRMASTLLLSRSIVSARMAPEFGRKGDSCTGEATRCAS